MKNNLIKSILIVTLLHFISLQSFSQTIKVRKLEYGTGKIISKLYMNDSLVKDYELKLVRNQTGDTVRYSNDSTEERKLERLVEGEYTLICIHKKFMMIANGILVEENKITFRDFNHKTSSKRKKKGILNWLNSIF